MSKKYKEKHNQEGEFMQNPQNKNSFLSRIDWPNISVILGALGILFTYSQTNFSRVDSKLEKIDDRMFVMQERLSVMEAIALRSNTICASKNKNEN